jgi:hypothetical protein
MEVSSRVWRSDQRPTYVTRSKARHIEIGIATASLARVQDIEA